MYSSFSRIDEWFGELGKRHSLQNFSSITHTAEKRARKTGLLFTYTLIQNNTLKHIRLVTIHAQQPINKVSCLFCASQVQCFVSALNTHGRSNTVFHIFRNGPPSVEASQFITGLFTVRRGSLLIVKART